MADFNADILLTVVTTKVDQAIDRLEVSFDRLSQKAQSVGSRLANTSEFKKAKAESDKLLESNRQTLSVYNAQIEAQKQLAGLEKQRTQAQKQQQKLAEANAKRLESVALGVGFPLLFGAGTGSVLGSLAGSFAGQGFGGQIFGGAVGQIVDDAVNSVAKLGQALNPLTGDIDAVTKAAGISGTSLEEYIKSLEKSGDAAAAAAEAQRVLATLVGDDGVTALQDFGEATVSLGNAFDRAMSVMAAGVARIINSLPGFLQFTQNLADTALLDRALASNDPAQAENLRRLEASRVGTGGVNIDQQQRAIQALVRTQRTLEAGGGGQEELAVLDKQLDIEKQKLAIAKLNGDITNNAVFEAEKELILKEQALQIQEVNNKQLTNAAKNKEFELIYAERLNKEASLLARRQQALDTASTKSAAERTREAEQALKALLKIQVLQAQLNTSTALLGIDKQIATAQVDGDKAKLAELEYTRALEASELKIAEIRARGISEAETQRRIKLEENRLEKELLDIDTKRALERKKLEKSFQTTVDGLTIELGLAQAVTREEENRLKLQQKRLSLQGNGLNEDQINQILELEGRLQAAQAPIQQYMTQLQKSLNDVDAQIVRMAQTIETELGSAMSSAITGVITGTQTVEQAMASMFENIGKAFIEMATQMLAQQLILSILKGFTGGNGGLPGFGMEGTLAGEGVFTGPLKFAEGGYPPVGQASLVGENGPELFVPGRQGAIVPNDIFAATRAALNKGGTSGAGAFEENAQALAVSSSYTRERVTEKERQTMLTGAGGSMLIQTEVINNVEYATVDQVAQAAAASAKQARAQVFADMRNKPSTRASLGMR